MSAAASKSVAPGFEEVCCNLCGADQPDELFHIQETLDERQPVSWRGTASIPVVRCRKCGLVYLNPRYNTARLEAIYQDADTFTGTLDPEGRIRSIATERALRVGRFRREVDALQLVFSPPGRLLDVGCGLGFFLEAIGSTYETMGLEWSHFAATAACELGFKVIQSDFPRHPFKKAEFDVVSFHNTLDHLPDPMIALRVARELLKPQGLLMLTTANLGSMAARIYGPGFRLMGTNHLYYFTPATLQDYLRRTGFEILNIEYPYFGTDFARPLAHAWTMLKDGWALHVHPSGERRLSPPFYGNIMRIFARKIE